MHGFGFLPLAKSSKVGPEYGETKQELPQAIYYTQARTLLRLLRKPLYQSLPGHHSRFIVIFTAYQSLQCTQKCNPSFSPLLASLPWSTLKISPSCLLALYVEQLHSQFYYPNIPGTDILCRLRHRRHRLCRNRRPLRLLRQRLPRHGADLHLDCLQPC